MLQNEGMHESGISSSPSFASQSASSRLFGVDAPDTILYGFFIGGLSSFLNTPD